MTRIFSAFILILNMLLLLACSRDFIRIKSEQSALLKSADTLSTLLSELKSEIKDTAIKTESLYIHKDILLSRAHPRKYKMHPSGVFYKPVNDGGSAVYVTGYVPINRKIKETVYFTEPLDIIFTDKLKKNQDIIQIYYNDKNSYNRIQPYFDVISQYAPKTDITSFNFYYLANEKNNPLKNAVWVYEPYMDPAGRGWIISVIAPVYYRDFLEGVCGMDINIDTLMKKLFRHKEGSYLLLLNDGRFISADEELKKEFNLPDLKDIRYVEGVVKEQYLNDQFNLLNASDNNLRQLAEKIITGNKYFTFSFNGIMYYVLTEDIKETKWHLVRLVKK